METAIPKPRIGVSDETLTRPDWTQASQRPSSAIWLDKNENIDPVLAEKTSKILADLNNEAVYTYPELNALYNKLANVMECSADQLVLAAGSDGVIRTIFETFISPGDIVLHTDPTFAMYFVYSKMYGAKSHQVAYMPSPQGPVLDLDKLLAQIHELQPRLVCLPNPDSPTGSVQSEQALEKIFKASQDAGSVLLIDEAYFPIYPKSCKDFVRKFPHMIVARSFGKAWGAAGVRVGFGIAHPAMATQLHKVKPMYEIGSLSAHFLYRLLDLKDDVKASVERLHQGKAFFAQEMEALGFRLIKCHGNFIHVDFGSENQKVHSKLHGKVLYRISFNDPSLKGFSRFSIAPKEIMEQVTNLIKQAVEN